MEVTTGTTTEVVRQRQRFGPIPHKLDTAWCTSVYGAEYVALALWIGKDWSWSQLGWQFSAILFGTLATVWMFFMTIKAYWQCLFSECYKNIIWCLWLMGLYAWMVGEFWTLWHTEGVLGQHALVFEERGNTIAKWTLLGAVILNAVLFAIFIPFDVFASDRRHFVLKQMELKSPTPYPGKSYFREFRMYSSMHSFMWVLKDAMWAWELPTAYAIAFLLTILLNLDLLLRFRQQPEQYIDTVNYIVILFWVVANGFWAFGELVANADATEDQFRRYSWPQWQIIHGTQFEFRYAAGWMFLLAGLLLFVFYVHWIVLTLRGKLPSYNDYENGTQVDHLPDKSQRLISEPSSSLDGTDLI